MFVNILQGVLENVLAALIVAVLGFASYLAVFVTERQRLLRFFGVSSQFPRLRIYLSRLEIKPGGATGLEPVSKGYSGAAINKIEYEGALLVREQFSSSILAWFPDNFRDWLGQQHAGLMALNPKVDVSPQQMGNVAFDNMVVLGNGIFNLVARYYLEHPSCYYQFKRNDKGVLIVKAGGLEGITIPGRTEKGDWRNESELAVLQRINDEEHKNSVFLCCGTGSSATFGAARYLSKNWRDLYRRHGSDEFAMCLEFPGQEPDSEFVVEPKVIPTLRVAS